MALSRVMLQAVLDPKTFTGLQSVTFAIEAARTEPLAVLSESLLAGFVGTVVCDVFNWRIVRLSAGCERRKGR